VFSSGHTTATLGHLVPESIGHSIQNTYYPSSIGTGAQNYPEAILLDYNSGETSGTQSRSFLNVSAEYLA
jgi:hypothetical protein